MKKRVHFVGIKGVGMTPLSLIAKEAGWTVTGSDIGEEFITDAILRKKGIIPQVGFSPERVDGIDLVIATGAHGGFDNVEVKAAREKGIELLMAGQAVGLFMDGEILERRFTGVSVTGTHGKTTTTAMISTILKETGYDPSFIIGTGDVSALGTPGHLGKGSFFIAEADEYAIEPKYDKRAKFLWQHPKIAVITNIEFDHPDIYPTIDDIKAMFLKFASQLADDAVIVAFGDDSKVRDVVGKSGKKVITYGFSPQNNYAIERVHVSGGQTFFWVNAYGTSLGEFAVRVGGEHNALNSLASIVTCLELGVPVDRIKKGLHGFTGSKRRLEFVGTLASGAPVYDDYAHHPTEIRKTLEALRKQYPNKKITCIFQPHTFSRTKMLFDEFVHAFDIIDSVILTEIYASLREEPDPTISSLKLSEVMQKHRRDVICLPELADVVKYIDKKRPGADTVLVTMGAGDVYKIHSDLRFL